MRIHQAVDDDVLPANTGGRQRTFGLARALARRHDMRLLCVVPNRSHGAAQELAAGVRIVRRRAWHTSVLWRLDRAGLVPMDLTAWGHDAHVPRYREALAGDADVVACDLHLAALLRRRGRALGVYASQNVEADRFAAEHAPMLARGAWRGAIAARERRVVHDADLVVVCSEDDAERMRALYDAPAAKFAVVPNGYDDEEVRPPVAEARAAARRALGLGPETCALLFVGADWEPNRRALAALERHLLPALAGEDVALLVAGAVTHALAAPRHGAVRAVGPVDDLAPVLAAADIGLNPVLSGGGSNVKLPLYLGAGLAVVTTPFGLRGYAALARHVCVQEVEGFADAVRGRPRGWAARGEPRPAAIAEHGWNTLGERLGDVLAARVAARRAA